MLTDIRVTTGGFLNCLLLSEPCRIYSHHCPSRLLSLHVNTFPTHIHPPLSFTLLFFCLLFPKDEAKKCSAVKNLTQNTLAALGSEELPDLSAISMFNRFHIFASQSGHHFMVQQFTLVQLPWLTLLEVTMQDP